MDQDQGSSSCTSTAPASASIATEDEIITHNNKRRASDVPEVAEADPAEDGDEDDDDDDDDDEEEDLDYYYYSFHDDVEAASGGGSNGNGLGCGTTGWNNNEDPEYFAFSCLTPKETQLFLMETVQSVCQAIRCDPYHAKILLHNNSWSLNDILHKYNLSGDTVAPSSSSSSSATGSTSPPVSAAAAVAKPAPSPTSSAAAASSSSSSSSHVAGWSGLTLSAEPAPQSTSSSLLCEVCVIVQPKDKFAHLSCGHRFCYNCWELHFACQIQQGISTGLSCMSIRCDTLAPEDFVLRHLKSSNLSERYLGAVFQEYVRSHPQLRFCPGKNCNVIIRGAKSAAKKCVCSSCNTLFCFQCGADYHAPTDCETIKRWLTKCADDSETANYISAHTKDCPACNICIEKNGGCNHMQCYNCKHDFCWMCLGDWKAHGSEYYECSRYKENPNIAHESAHAQAREALKKYLHYFERWENHSKSMKLEAQTLEKIKNRITAKVMSGSGTWIDWQYLMDASALLAKCRYTLQYTYPYAYYMERCPRKELFEYQQAQLEAEIENLSWKIEHAETTDRGDLENQIDIAEKRRTSLLKDFLSS